MPLKKDYIRDGGNHIIGSVTSGSWISAHEGRSPSPLAPKVCRMVSFHGQSTDAHALGWGVNLNNTPALFAPP
jgi:hypothetical protein